MVDADLGRRTAASGVSMVDGQGRAEASCSLDEQDRTHGYALWAQAGTLQEVIRSGDRTHESGQSNCHEEAI